MDPFTMRRSILDVQWKKDQA